MSVTFRGVNSRSYTKNIRHQRGIAERSAVSAEARPFLGFWIDFNLTFVADRPPPPPIAYPDVLMAAETSAEYSS